MKILIIGGDAAGMSAASQVRRREKDWEITVLEQGPFTSYSACGIPYFFSGEVLEFEDLIIVSPEQFREKKGINVLTGHRAESIDLKEKSVLATNQEGKEQNFTFDKLMIATGARPIIPDWPGMDLQGVSTLRNLSDTQRVQKLLAGHPQRCVVIGGGYIGLEMVEAFHTLGLQITLLEKTPGLMGNAESLITEKVLENLTLKGVETHLETTVTGFAGSNGKLQSVQTDQGEFPADLALVSLGIQPNSELASGCGLLTGEKGAIVVDRGQRTSDPGVFAAGDCAEVYHLILERNTYIPLALNANRGGRVAGANLAGHEESFPGTLGSAVTRVFDINIARTGLDEPTLKREKIPYKTVTVQTHDRAEYMQGNGPLWVKIFYHEENHLILGAWVFGEDAAAGKRCDILATAISAKLDLGQVADLDLNYAPPFSGVWDPILQAANKARFGWK